jgi:hypothetical protein
MNKVLSFIACILFLILAPVSIKAQNDETKYLEGAVTLKNGYVEFEKSYNVPGKSQEEIFDALQNYIQNSLIDGPESLKQSRMVKADSTNFTIVADLEEWLYFKRKAWVTHRTRFYYQIIAQAEEGRFNIIMRRIHYLYDEEERPGMAEPYHAEEWITDDMALNKEKTKLTRIAGKFRRYTIERKDEIFTNAARAAGAKVKVLKVIEVEE